MHFMDPKWQKQCTWRYILKEFIACFAVSALLFWAVSCTTLQKPVNITNEQVKALHADRPSLEERYGYSYEQYKKLMRHLILLGKVEERIVFAYRVHYSSGYEPKDKTKYWTFQIVKRINDPSQGVELHAYVIKYYPANLEGKRRTEWRRNWILFDDDMDGYPDRHITSFWSVGKDGKLEIDYNLIKSMNDLPETEREKVHYNLRHYLWKSFIRQLMKTPFDYYDEEAGSGS